jgi:hypothetical protein
MEDKYRVVFKLKEKILNSLDGMAQVLVVPDKYFQEVLEKGKAINGLYFLIFFSAFFGFMMGSLLSNLGLAIIIAILFIVLGLLKIFIWSGISHLIAKFVFKGEGSFVPTFGLFGYAFVSFTLGIVGLATLMVAGTVFATFLMWLLMAVWFIVLATVAVATEHKIGVGRAFLSVTGIPVLVIIVLSLIVGVL